MIQTPSSADLPPVLAGPILRRLEPGRLVLWLVGSAALDLVLELAPHGAAPRRVPLDDACRRVVRVGTHAYIHLIDVALDQPLPQDTLVDYDLLDAGGAGIAQWAPHLLHAGQARPSFVLRSRMDNILYGSCRKPHHRSRDGLACADALLAGQLGEAEARPAMLMLCGDQVYADDVAGPMLAAVHALVKRLGLYGECLEGAVVEDSDALYAHPAGYYRREDLLPAFTSNEDLRERFFGGSEKPIFTTANAHNHLVTLAEVMAMYLLVWSPAPWRIVGEPAMPPLKPKHVERWQRERAALQVFCAELPQAARLLAHVQTLMIFGGSEKPIFTTANAHNHLVTLAEVMAMYLLVWSPAPWRIVGEPAMPPLKPKHVERWQRERAALQVFCAELPQAARLLAHVQTLMIFDDHDITDDWNLSAKWETTAYEHPFSRRIIGNALVAYMLCQGWGNRPDVFGEALDAMVDLSAAPDARGRLDPQAQDALIRRLLAFNQWDYMLRTQPAIIVLDTRTRRWRNRRTPSHPSGLMDWESLTELQHELLDETAAVIVSPAPMFGVKLIEVVQRLATFAGQALTVDAENWMAHRGAASSMLNIFRHSRTPGNYVILSGDVHYSFVYDVEVRESDRPQHVWQITSSGIKNEFPRRLLDWLDRLNRWLYSPRSPLNWFTKRRDLALSPRLPDQRTSGERLWNGSGIGQVWLDAQGRPTRIVQHNADGRPSTQFLLPNDAPAATPAVEEARRA